MAVVIAEDAVDAIGYHVHQQANSNDPCFAMQQKQDISYNGNIRMKRMEVDATPALLKNRIS